MTTTAVPRASATTTIAAGSNGLVLPQATIDVASLGGTAESEGGFVLGGGEVLIQVGSGWTLVTYTGSAVGQLTGCSGGAGILLTGASVVQAWSVGSSPVRVTGTQCYQVQEAGDWAFGTVLSTINGVIWPVQVAGIATNQTAHKTGLTFGLSFPCDAGGVYAILNTAGTSPGAACLGIGNNLASDFFETT